MEPGRRECVVGSVGRATVEAGCVVLASGMYGQAGHCIGDDVCGGIRTQWDEHVFTVSEDFVGFGSTSLGDGAVHGHGHGHSPRQAFSLVASVVSVCGRTATSISPACAVAGQSSPVQSCFCSSSPVRVWLRNATSPRGTL